MKHVSVTTLKVVGRDGERRNVTQLFHLLAVPRNRPVQMKVAHDHDCPCIVRSPRLFTGMLDDCSCDEVDIVLQPLDGWWEERWR